MFVSPIPQVSHRRPGQINGLFLAGGARPHDLAIHRKIGNPRRFGNIGRRRFVKAAGKVP
jgi:hypothetical protein